MADPTGKAAVEIAMDRADPEDLTEAEAEQLELLGLPNSPRLIRLQRERAERAEKKTGRPQGARNKRDVARAEVLLRIHGDPRAALLRLANMRVDVLAAALGCKPIEALQEIRLAARDVLPYVAQKQPIAIDVTSRKLYRFEVVEGGDPGDRDGGEASLSAPFVKLLQRASEAGGIELVPDDERAATAPEDGEPRE